MIKAIRKNPICETIIFAGYMLMKQLTNKDSRSAKGTVTFREKADNIQEKPLEEFHIAIISDGLTYVNFEKECHLHKLTPNNWKQVFREHQIDLFLCESAWEGCKENHQCWRGRIYKNHRVLFETRKTLFDILSYCEKSGIPTVFWNKEDPTYFGNETQDFVDTALHFQYIFTTATECISRYQQRGNSHVGHMMFGFSPDIYNPSYDKDKEQRAIFAGSWFSEQKKRCDAESALFDKIIRAGIPLTIFDRQYGCGKKERIFPERYQQYVHPAITQKELGAEIKKCRYAININTVTDSETMFARRVYELMASNVYILSSESVAMERLLNGRYSNLNDDLPEDVENICRNNVDYVFTNHTNRQRLIKMIQDIGLPIKKDLVTIAICSSEAQNIQYYHESIEVKCVTRLQEVDTDVQYFIIWNRKDLPPLDKMLAHANYVNKNTVCGVRVERRNLYRKVEDTENEETLFPACMLEQLQADIHLKTLKYHI